MKTASCFLLISLLIVSPFLLSSLSAARLLSSPQDQKEIAQMASSVKQMKEDFSTLIGTEECEVKDEECLKRREIAEAHLDYIYTQHQKNP